MPSLPISTPCQRGNRLLITINSSLPFSLCSSHRKYVAHAAFLHGATSVRSILTEQHDVPLAAFSTLPFSTASEPSPAAPPPTSSPAAAAAAPMSILQRAILQSDQQFNANPAPTYSSNGFNSVAPFQPFDLLPQNTYPGFPIGMNMNQPSTPYHQPHASPVQLNNVRIGSPQILSSPQLPHPSPPSQTPSQAVTSPRMSGGSTLQFVPSQVLRNMPKSHK